MEKNWAEVLDEEHRLIEKVLLVLEREAARAKSDKAEFGRLSQVIDFLINFADKCHHQKEEKVLFPALERRGIPRAGGPIAVMLTEHDRGRQLIQQMKTTIDKRDGEGLGKAAKAYLELLKDHIWKEDDILYPAAKKVLTTEDNEQLVADFEEIEEEIGKGIHKKYALMVKELEKAAVRPLVYDLPIDIMDVILDTLPFEITFVDDEDTVRYFNKETQYKIFSRTRAVVGRKVQQCHPERSVHLVNQILDDFKRGERDVAEFWINHKDKKIHISYLAVRDRDGKYLGCLEVTQDITDIKKLEGEKRLL